VNYAAISGVHNEPTSTLAFIGTSGTQKLYPRQNNEMPNITKTGASTLQLRGYTLNRASSFTMSAGTLDFNGFDLECDDSQGASGDFTITNGTSTTFTGLAGRTITVDGNATLSGQEGSLLNLFPASPCTLDVSGSLRAVYSDIGNNVASGSQGETYRCTNSGSNSGWVFENYANWSYSADITVNTTSTGADVSGNVLDFPVLVRLEGRHFDFSKPKSDGSDVRFAKSDGTELFYEIERWDVAGAMAEIWVRLDTVYGNNGSQSFTMYWGKGDAVDRSNGDFVFDDAIGYAGAWHLNEDPSGGSNAVKDRSPHSNHGTSGGSMTSSDLVSGNIGRALQFDGSDDGITAADASSLDITSAVTVSAWFRAGSLDDWVRLAAKSHTSEASPYTVYGLLLDDNDHIRGEISDGGTQYFVNGSTTLNTADYFHAVFTYDGSNLKLYLNGSQEGNTTSHSGDVDANSQVFSIAKSGYDNDYFNGNIDEVRLSNTARSADWIKLSYQNQKFNQVLVNMENIFLALAGGTMAGDIDMDSNFITGVDSIVADVVNAGKVVIDGWTMEVPDYVFDKDYKLLSLSQVEAYIRKNGHLPDVPGAARLKAEGMDVGKMNLMLLKHIEQINLHLIAQEKQIKKLEALKKRMCY
jgi:hypothetical protein